MDQKKRREIKVFTPQGPLRQDQPIVLRFRPSEAAEIYVGDDLHIITREVVIAESNLSGLLIEVNAIAAPSVAKQSFPPNLKPNAAFRAFSDR